MNESWGEKQRNGRNRRSVKGYDCLDGVVLVVDGRRRAGEVVDLVDLEQDGLDDVVADHLEVGVGEVVHDVVLAAGEEVVDDDDAVAALEEAVDEVAADEAGAAGDEHAERLALEAQRHLAADEVPRAGQLAVAPRRLDGEAGERVVGNAGGGGVGGHGGGGGGGRRRRGLGSKFWQPGGVRLLRLRKCLSPGTPLYYIGFRFPGAGDATTRPWKWIFRSRWWRHPPLEIFFNFFENSFMFI